MSNYPCYDGVLGLADTDCDCTEAGRPSDYDASSSGLYISDLADIGSLVNNSECGSDMWDLLIKSRDLAITRTVTASNALLGKKFIVKRKTLRNEVLGQIKATNYIAGNKSFAVVKFTCAPIRGGIFRLRAIGGIFKNIGDTVISLYNNVDGHIQDFTLSTTAAGKHAVHTLDTPLELPLFSKYANFLEYYLTYPIDTANLAKDNEVDCGCAGLPKVDKDRPYFYNIPNSRKSPWADYVMVSGTEIDDLLELDDMDEVAAYDLKMKGLTIEADFTCKVHEVLCEDSLDFVGNPLAMALANAIKFAAGVEVANAVQRSSVLSRSTLVNAIEWDDSREEWEALFQEHINYVVANVEHTSNDCLKCRDLLGMTRQGIFS